MSYDKELSIKIFREKLENYYKTIFGKLKIFGTDMVLDMNKHYQQLKIIQNNNSLNEKTFKNQFNNKKIRYLFKGIMGSGKTTLVRNICYNWASQEEYLSQYKLIIYLELKCHITEDSKTIIDLIKSNYRGLLNSFEINQILNEYQDEILFIFDGLDELQTFKEKEVFYEINKFVQNSIVVSRTNSININKLLITSIFDIQGFSHVESLKKITSTKGFKRKKKIIVYFKELLGTDTEAFFAIMRIRTDIFLSEMLYNPLCLIIIRNNLEKNIDNRYEFYQNIIRDIVLEYNKFLDVVNLKFNFNEYNNGNKYLELNSFIMDKLATFANTKNLNLLKVEEINYILSLGFLETNNYQTIKQFNNYEFIYKFFQKYFDAYFIVNKKTYSEIKQNIESVKSFDEDITFWSFLNILLSKKNRQEYMLLQNKFEELFEELKKDKMKQINILYETQMKPSNLEDVKEEYFNYMEDVSDKIIKSNLKFKLKEIYKNDKL